MSSSKAKKERRQFRHERNYKKDKEYKEDAWDSGKLIYENHNDGYFSPEYSIEFLNRLSKKVLEDISFSEDLLIQEYRKIKCHIIAGILRYNPEIPKSKEYEFLKYSLETYWDNLNNFKNTLIEWIKNH